MATKFNTKYAHSRLDGIKFDDPSLTQQQFVYESDINNIVNNMAMANLKENPPQFGLTFTPNQYENALNTVAEARSAFEELPSHIREKFGQDPKRLLEFIDDPKNYEEGVKLGIFKGELLDKMKLAYEATQPTVPTSDKTEVTEVSSQ